MLLPWSWYHVAVPSNICIYNNCHETGTAREPAKPETNILGQAFNKPNRPPVAVFLLDLFDSSERAPGGVAGFFGAHPVLDVVLDLHFKMQAKLFIKLSIQTAFLEQSEKARSKPRVPGHQVSPYVSPYADCVCSSRNTAPASRSQFSVSAVNCLRPAGVSE